MKKLEFTYNLKELESKLLETLGFIKAEIEKNHYEINNEENFKKLLKYNFKSHIGNLSKRSLKRLNRQIWRIQNKRSRGSMNRFLHFIRTRVISKKIEYTPDWAKGYYENYVQIKYEYPLESIKILPSLKEQEIQKKRKEWKELRDKTQKALLSYKEEKGDFYKKQLENDRARIKPYSMEEAIV